MRGHKDVRILYAADRAGLALLLAMVLFAGSLATALTASAAEKGNPGSHGNPGTSSNNGNEGNSGGSQGNPGSSNPSNGNNGNEGTNGNNGQPGNEGNNNPSNGNPGNEGNNGNEGNGGGGHGSSGNEGNGNGGKGNDGKGNPGKPGKDGDDEEPDVDEEPALPDEDGEGDGDGDEVLGSRLVRSRVTLTYRNGAFRGRVFSQRDRCETGRTVNVKRRNGTLIGRDKTNRKGRFVVPARKQAGRFKARVGRKSFTRPQRDVKVVCLADRNLLRITAK